MKAALYATCLTAMLVVGGTTSAMADDFVATCQASRPSGLPASADVSNDHFCGCADKETAGNEKLRAEFVASLKIKEFDKRTASLSDAGKAVVAKCTAH